MNENEEMTVDTSEQPTQDTVQAPEEAAVQPEAAQYSAPQGNEYTPNSYTNVVAEPTKKSNVPLFICIGVGVVLIAAIVIGLLNFNYLYAKIAPEAYVIKSATKTLDVVTAREKTTPFIMCEDLINASKDGTISFAGSMSDEENDLNLSGNMSVSRDLETRQNEYKLGIDFLGLTADVSGFSNDEYVTFTSSLFGTDEVFGLDYEDAFSRINDKFDLGMSEDEIKASQEELDAASKAVEFDFTKYDKSFLSLRDEFVKSMKAEVSYETVSLNEKDEKCIVVNYTVTKDKLIALLNTYLEIVKNDEDIKEAIELLYPSSFGVDSMYSYEEDYTGMSNYEICLSELEKFVEDFEENYDGTFNIKLISNKSGYFVSAVVSGNASYYDADRAEWDDDYINAPVYFNSVLDLGANPATSNSYEYNFSFSNDEEKDTYENYFKIVLTENENTDASYSGELCVSFKEYSDFMEDSEIGITRANLSLDRTSGDFTIATETETYYQSYSTDSEIEKATVSGNFKRDDNGNFTLDINDISSEADEDDYYSSDYKYTFSISAAQGADITAPASYKELDDWTDEDIEKMSSGIQEFVLRAYLGDSYDDYASMY